MTYDWTNQNAVSGGPTPPTCRVDRMHFSAFNDIIFDQSERGSGYWRARASSVTGWHWFFGDLVVALVLTAWTSLSDGLDPSVDPGGRELRMQRRQPLIRSKPSEPFTLAIFCPPTPTERRMRCGSKPQTEPRSTVIGRSSFDDVTKWTDGIGGEHSLSFGRTRTPWSGEVGFAQAEWSSTCTMTSPAATGRRDD